MITFLQTGRFAIPPDDSIHLAPYNVPYKWLILDGKHKSDFSAVPAEDYGANFAAAIDIARSESTYVSLAIDRAYVDSAGGMIAVRVMVDTIMPDQSLRLLGVLTEDSVATRARFPLVFDRVARKFLPDALGKPIQPARFDTLFDTLCFNNTGFRASKLKAAIFVMNENNHEIIQSATLWRFPQSEK